VVPGDVRQQRPRTQSLRITHPVCRVGSGTNRDHRNHPGDGMRRPPFDAAHHCARHCYRPCGVDDPGSAGSSRIYQGNLRKDQGQFPDPYFRPRLARSRSRSSGPSSSSTTCGFCGTTRQAAALREYPKLPSSSTRLPTTGCLWCQGLGRSRLSPPLLANRGRCAKSSGTKQREQRFRPAGTSPEYGPLWSPWCTNCRVEHAPNNST